MKKKIIQRLIYPDSLYTTRLQLDEVPTECFTLEYEHHFWIDDGKLNTSSVCLCGKEKLGEEI